MAVNSFNPRLFSSTSENDVDEVFRHKGGSVVPVGGNPATAKTRSFNEPVSLNKDGQKEDSKVFGKTPALSDSSNFLRRQKGIANMNSDSDNPPGNFMKSECSPIFEEVTQFPSTTLNPDREKSAIDIIFPEPERSREEIKEAYKISLLLEEDESMDAMIPNLGRATPNDELLEFDEVLDNGNDVFYMRDVSFGGTNDAIVHGEDQQLIEDDEDENYPEREYIPPGYASCVAQDLPYAPCPWDLPRSVLASYSDLDLDKLPELPDDLIKETTIFPFEMERDFENLSPAMVPSLFAPPSYELKMKMVFGKNN